jgi:hypothetical protein
MLAITLTLPPHCSQLSISIPNTRLSRCAQRMARCRSAGVRRSVDRWSELGQCLPEAGDRRRGGLADWAVIKNEQLKRQTAEGSIAHANG